MKPMNIQQIKKLALYLMLGLFLIGCQPLETNPPETTLNESSTSETQIEELSSYTSKDEVALYIYTFEKLPDNFITKQQAMKLGWDNSKGNLWEIPFCFLPQHFAEKGICSWMMCRWRNSKKK